jgi:hypothetical protein
MGWWDHGIMGGDTPYDVAGTLEDFLGVKLQNGHMCDCWTDKEQEVWRKAFNRKSWTKLKAKAIWASSGDEEVGVQVLGFMMMCCGAKLHNKAKNDIRNACLHDEWAQEDDQRKAIMFEMLDAVSRYNNEPMTITQHGLLEKMCGG